MSPLIDASSRRGSFNEGQLSLPLSTPTELLAAHVSSTDGSPLNTPLESPSLPPPKRPLRPGVYVPTVCFFDPKTEDVDTFTIAQHAVRLAEKGVSGLATQGSNGEAVHLTHSERQLVTTTTRKALDKNGFQSLPVIVGCGAQSTRETVQYCLEAWEAGGDYALVLPPSYYVTLFASSSETVLKFFQEVADASPIPILIYNFPGGAGGLDLSSDVIVELARHPNIVGAKFTCGNTGKLNRVADATRRPCKGVHGDDEPDFLVLAGSADFTIQAAVAGGHGILAGLGNIAPKACVRTLELFRHGRYARAQEMQSVLSQADWVAIQGGVVGVKAGMEAWLGYGGFARAPLPRPTDEEVEDWREGFRGIVALENEL